MRPLLLLAALSVSTAAFAKSDPEKPNLVVFLVDDMGVMDTSVPFLTNAAGEPEIHPLNRFYRTPNMERLAASGIRFSRFEAMSVCSPTRVSILTGQNAARHRTTNWIDPKSDNRGPKGPPEWNWRGLDEKSVTLPKVLHAAGYRTIHVGKGHLGPEGSPGADPLKLGYDENVGGAATGQPGSYYGSKNYGKGGAHAVPGLDAYHGTDVFLTDALTREAKTRMSRAVADGKPFYLNFAHYAVHAPFDSDPRYAANYANSGKPKQAQAFATLIEGMDRSLGDIMAHLRELGVAENTLVVFLGDNGSDSPLGGPHEVASAAPLRGKKGSHYEGGTRVPFIAAWAAPDPENSYQKRVPVAAGAIQGQIASVCDIFPTLLAAADVPLPANHTVDGKPLQTLFTGKPDPARPREFVMHYPHAPHRSDYFTVFLRDEWKVVYHYFPGKASSGSHYQLFRLSDDPYESHDLAPDHPAELSAMMKGLAESLESMNALYPTDGKGNPVKPKVP
ncbi:MAG: sulfatase [Verrucomicrobia bacterium]|nr:sulfatase [Verrucomicrobiota bacterium]